MSLRPLGIVKEVVESIGMGISYAYDDLVFMEHNGFLLQFAEADNVILIHINSEADKSELQDDITRLKQAGFEHNLEFKDGAIYTMTQADDANIRIEFSS